MQVVYSAAHLGHDPAVEIEAGVPVRPYESPDRAEVIRRALSDDAEFTIGGPRQYGTAPLAAVHDRDYLVFLERAWSDWTTAMPDRRYAIADSFPNPALRDGMGAGRPPHGAVARLSYYGFDTATVIVEGTYAAARAAADAALTAADAVLGGDDVAYALCRP